MSVKSSKLWKIIWISGIYIILAIILYLVVLYKVKWEHKDLNTYLYFYECDNSLCTSSTSQNGYYSKIICENDKCPYINSIINDFVILSSESQKMIYNYILGEIVSNDYIDYRYIGNDMLVITDVSNNQGIIDFSGKVLVDAEYQYIDSYKNGFISYKKNNLYGINTDDKKFTIEPTFEHIVLINDILFAGMKDNKYNIYTYENITKESDIEYDYLYAHKDVILTINNKKIDILTTDLNSTLLLKIDTFYEYTREKERESLDIYYDDEFIYFKVINNNNQYKEYRYNFLQKKLM